MSLAKTWFTLDEAESKFGVSRAMILKWVDEGMIRCEQMDTRVVSVNGDDLELKLKEFVRKG